jgi:multidrug resistance efflux pump
VALRVTHGRQAVRIAVTLAAVAAAVAVVWQLWDYYTVSPWTRDGLVRANVVQIAPDVSGLISKLNAVDNQAVRRDDVLFVIDQQRFQVAVEQAEAVVEQKRQAQLLAQSVADRNATLRAQDNAAISDLMNQQSQVAAAIAAAELKEAQAQLATARINLARTEVRSPVNGYVTNLVAELGDYASTGQGVLAVVDSDSFYVDGYFMETKLPAIQVGDRARVTLMAGGAVIGGSVESISRGIADPQGGTGSELLAAVNPNFAWIRLAQRIPVRIKLDEVPPDVRLVSGLTCTVVVDPDSTPAAASAP